MEQDIPTTPTTEPVPPPPPPEPERPDPMQEFSVADHAKQFGTPQEREPASEEAPLEPKAHHSADQRREKDTGQFRDGKKRHRAASAIASPDDVPRIGQLTARAKTAEERVAALEAEVARLRVAPQPQPQPQPAPQPSNGNGQPPQPPIAARVPQAPGMRVSDPNDPEPQETDPQFSGDPMKYLDARFRWAARDEQRQFWAQQQRQAREEAVNSAFAERIDKALEKYADFHEVALTREFIPHGSLIDQFVMTDDNGPDVLYHLAQHPDELGAILRVPPFEQVKRLALLSQRFASPPSVQAGGTGSVATPQVRYLPPRPPNPVRTEAQRAGSDPAPTDGSLSIADHAKQFGPKPRR